jgi:ABC-type dipeptide/oligopeptide/nickel transport system ATPase component
MKAIYRPTENPVIEWVRSRFKRNKNWLAVIVGETGSGKSYSALTLAKAIDPSFNANRVVFDVKSFVNMITHEGLKEGNIVVYDEAGVGMDSKMWYSVQNKAMRYILQTFRRDNIGVIFTVPDITFIDKDARKLIHSFIETESIDYQRKLSYLKWYNIKVNARTDTVIMSFPRFISEDGRVIVIRRVATCMPPEDLVKEYEQRKVEYTEQLKREMLDEIELDKKKKKFTKRSIDMLLDRFQNPDAGVL